MTQLNLIINLKSIALCKVLLVPLKLTVLNSHYIDLNFGEKLVKLFDYFTE